MRAPLSNIASGFPFHTELSPSLISSAAFGAAWDAWPDAPKLPPLPFTAESAGLAHDAGNLLGALGLYCELLGSPGVLRDEHRHYAAELSLLSGRSRELMARLLDPRTTERREQPAAPSSEQVIIPEVIECCRGLLERIARRSIEVAYGPGAASPVAISRAALERILMNLAKNAAEASEGDAAIVVRVGCSRDESSMEEVVLTVEDRGCGMSVAAVRVLMEGGSARLWGDRGIGFQVVRELVGSSGGRLRLTSRQGHGTKVEVTWAVCQTPAALMVSEGSKC